MSVDANSTRYETVQNSDIHLHVKDVRKEFTNVVALNDVSFKLRSGEVVGLVGENGAGKSTFLNILSGIYQQDKGRIYVNDTEVNISNPRKAYQQGIAIVHQEHNIIQNLTGYENLFLEQLPDYSTGGVLDSTILKQEGTEILDTLGINLDLTKRVSDYSFSDQQMLSIAKAFTGTVHADHPIVLLDEPTAGLEEDGRNLLFDRIKNLHDQASFVFVSHELDEVLEISDRIYVLRDGQIVNHLQRSDATESKLQQSMVGREISEEYYCVPKQRNVENKETVLSVSDLSDRDNFDSVSFEVQEGEIFGVCGVIGSGKNALGRVLSGVDDADSGKIAVHGEPVKTGSVNRMLNTGVGYVPKERQSEGVLLYQPLRVNTSLSSLGTNLTSEKVPGLGSVPWIINFDEEKEIAKNVVDRFNIKTPSIETPLIQLSGGNQQKVVLGKALQRDTSVLIMDNVTRGIDVGAKEEVYNILRQLADVGVSVVFIADELPELIGMSNRIAVMRDGTLVDIVDATVGNKPTESEIIKGMV